MMFPSSRDRVPLHTADDINERIYRQIEDNVRYYASAGPYAIERRLAELDQEWDIERMIETNASTLVLIGMMLGTTVDRRWYVLPTVVAGFLLQHALQGWCPPVPVFRRMGARTRSEIDYERYALKALRGDFRNAPSRNDRLSRAEVGRLLRAVES